MRKNVENVILPTIPLDERKQTLLPSLLEIFIPPSLLLPDNFIPVPVFWLLLLDAVGLFASIKEVVRGRDAPLII